MARTIYSTNFLNQEVTDYVTPAGYVAVLRSIDVWEGTEGEFAGVLIGDFGYFGGLVDAGGTARWTGRQVIPAGFEMVPFQGAVCASGYLLLAP